MERIIIAGAAGRDFHDFNMVFRDNSRFEVVAFTATQIPNIEGRHYPPSLAGNLYPSGIPIYPESELPELITKHAIDQVVFSYSDVSHEYVMHLASKVLAAGTDFHLLGPHRTMLKSKKPVVSVGAVRTGAGKSQTSRHVVTALKQIGYKNVVAVRHPMPYGDLSKQAVQRFESFKDLDRENCTIEEREEYEPYIDMGVVIFSGIDYPAILKEVEKEAEIIVWDGGNNDLPFFQSDVHIVVADPHRPGHETRYHPGETNLRRADVVIINKVDTANVEDVLEVRENIARLNSHAIVILAASPLTVENALTIQGKRVLVVEDGPTLTHGNMAYGAGVMAARFHGAAEIIDPRPFAVGSIADTYKKYPETGPVLPAMGYDADQVKELEETINMSPADIIIVATPIDLGRIMEISKPVSRVTYRLQEIGNPTIKEILEQKLHI